MAPPGQQETAKIMQHPYGQQAKASGGEGAFYVIQVRGVLDPSWQAWLGNMAITGEPGGDTLLTGQVPDQSALYGLLSRLRDLGLVLISVKRGEPGAP